MTDTTSAADESGPTARRIMLGAQLRRLREAAGVRRADAGYAIRGSDSKLSRIESGKVGFKERDVADLLTLYGIGDPEQRELILDMARRSNEAGWWQPFADVIPDWFSELVGLEVNAQRIQTYETMFVPGLLQTEDYARAVVTGGHPADTTPDQERRIDLRMRRQRLLGQHDAPTLWAVIDESVLLRPVGGYAVLAAQIDRLMELSSRPHVVLQILPFALSGYAAEGPFSMLRFTERELPDLVYVEQLTSAAYLDKRSDVEAYGRVMDRLTIDAHTPAHSRQLLDKARSEH